MREHRFQRRKENNMDGYGNKEIIAKIQQYTPTGYCQNEDIVVATAQGCRFTDISGKEYLDFTSGIFTNTFGHCFKPLIEKEIEQINKCDNIHNRRSLAELELYQALQMFMPDESYKFIPYNDGGYAVDRALSDIINYYNKERIPIAAFRGGFHGKTMGTKLTINETAKAALFENFQLEYPNCYRCPWKKKRSNCGMICVQKTCEKLKEKGAKAIIFEVIQGAGVIIPPQGFWQKIADFCQHNNIVMFADEVLTAGGRTGYFLASYGLYHIKPDVISITKGLANGRPLSVICEKKYITENQYAKRIGERSSTFASHPVNMAVAAKNLECLRQYDIFANVQKMGDILSKELAKIKSCHQEIGDVRSVGLMGAIEFVKTQESQEPYTELCRKIFYQARLNGLETILSGHILRLAPPLNITQKDLLEGMQILALSIKECIENKEV